MTGWKAINRRGAPGDLAILLDRDNRLALGMVALMSMGSAVLDLLAVACIYPLVKIIGGPGGSPPEWLRPIFAAFSLRRPGDLLLAAVLGFFGLVLFRSIYNLGLLRFQERWYQRVSLETSARLIDRYMAAPWSDHLFRNSSDLIAVADGAATWPLVSSLRSHVARLTETIVLAGVVAIMLIVAPLPTLLSLGILGAIFVPVARATGRRMKALSEEGPRTVSDRLRLIRQAFDGLREIRILGRADYFASEYLEARRRDGDVQRRFNIAVNTPRLALEPAVVGAWALVTASVVLFKPAGMTDTIAVLGVFAVGALRLMPSLTRILSAHSTIRGNLAAVGQIAHDLRRNAPAQRSPAGSPALAWRTVALENVRFAYPGASGDAIAGISLTVTRGQSIGLVGASGSGKSTVADILTGLLEPTAGRVTVDGADIAADRTGWQSQIGYVPQRVALLDASLLENVAYGIAHGGIDRARVAAAVNSTGLSDVIARFPAGLDTPIGEYGARLSGGERQRIGLARAIYHGRDLMVLDEATSALDGASETEITAAVERLRGRHTFVIIAHRTALVRHCDEVLVLDEGRVVDRGRFSELTQRQSFEPDRVPTELPVGE